MLRNAGQQPRSMAGDSSSRRLDHCHAKSAIKDHLIKAGLLIAHLPARVMPSNIEAKYLNSTI